MPLILIIIPFALPLALLTLPIIGFNTDNDRDDMMQTAKPKFRSIPLHIPHRKIFHFPIPYFRKFRLHHDRRHIAKILPNDTHRVLYYIAAPTANVTSFSDSDLLTVAPSIYEEFRGSCSLYRIHAVKCHQITWSKCHSVSRREAMRGEEM